MKAMQEQRNKFKALEIFNDAWELACSKKISNETSLTSLVTLILVRFKDYEMDHTWKMVQEAYESARKEMKRA